jgi:hypothetical protein
MRKQAPNTNSSQEVSFDDFFNNRSHYPDYVDPQTGLLDVSRFAKDHRLGKLAGSLWRLNDMRIHRTWNMTSALYSNINFGDNIIVDPPAFENCRFHNVIGLTTRGFNTRLTNFQFSQFEFEGVFDSSGAFSAFSYPDIIIYYGDFSFSNFTNFYFTTVSDSYFYQSNFNNTFIGTYGKSEFVNSCFDDVHLLASDAVFDDVSSLCAKKTAFIQSQHIANSKFKNSTIQWFNANLQRNKVISYASRATTVYSNYFEHIRIANFSFPEVFNENNLYYVVIEASDTNALFAFQNNTFENSHISGFRWPRTFLTPESRVFSSLNVGASFKLCK